MKTVQVENDYPFAAEKLWAIVIDYDALALVMQGIVAFDGLPKGQLQTGQKFEVMVSLFGKLPPQPYTLDVLERDDAGMTFRSSERGAGVKRWNHTLTVTETPEGCRVTDRIEVDAGFLTPVFAIWAGYLYRARHKPRLELLQQGWTRR